MNEFSISGIQKDLALQILEKVKSEIGIGSEQNENADFEKLDIAQKTFGSQMTNEEEILHSDWDSYFITNRAVYSKTLGKPIFLNQIFCMDNTANIEQGAHREHVLIFINGRSFAQIKTKNNGKDSSPAKFVLNLLSALKTAAQNIEQGTLEPDDQLFLLSNLIDNTKMDDAAREQILSQAGMDSIKYNEVLKSMKDIQKRPRRMKAVVQLLTILILFGLTVLVNYLILKSDSVSLPLPFDEFVEYRGALTVVFSFAVWQFSTPGWGIHTFIIFLTLFQALLAWRSAVSVIRIAVGCPPAKREELVAIWKLENKDVK